MRHHCSVITGSTIRLDPWNRLDVDFRAGARHYYAAIGLDVLRFEERLRCSQIHVGLAGQAYVADAGNWTDLQAASQPTLNVAT